MGQLKFHNELVFFTLITLINFSPLLTSFFRKSFYLFVFFLLLWRWNFLQWYLMFSDDQHWRDRVGYDCGSVLWRWVPGDSGRRRSPGSFIWEVTQTSQIKLKTLFFPHSGHYFFIQQTIYYKVLLINPEKYIPGCLL